MAKTRKDPKKPIKKRDFQHPHVLLRKEQKDALEKEMGILQVRENNTAMAESRKPAVVNRMDAFQYIYVMYKRYMAFLSQMKGKNGATGSKK